MNRLLLLSIFLSSCGGNDNSPLFGAEKFATNQMRSPKKGTIVHNPTPPSIDITRKKNDYQIHSDFNEYIQSWKERYHTKVRLHMGFRPLDGDIIGECILYDDGYKWINIDPDAWEGYPDIQRKALIWHELGHCDLGLEHNKKLDKTHQCPLTIMYPILPNEGCLDLGLTSFEIGP